MTDSIAPDLSFSWYKVTTDMVDIFGDPSMFLPEKTNLGLSYILSNKNTKLKFNEDVGEALAYP